MGRQRLAHTSNVSIAALLDWVRRERSYHRHPTDVQSLQEPFHYELGAEVEPLDLIDHLRLQIFFDRGHAEFYEPRGGGGVGFLANFGISGSGVCCRSFSTTLSAVIPSAWA